MPDEGASGSVPVGDVVAIKTFKDDPLALGMLYQDEQGGEQELRLTTNTAPSTQKWVSGLAQLTLCVPSIEDQQEEACSICYEALRCSPTLIRKLRCGHKFHSGCINPWLSAKPHCPLCRAPVCISSFRPDRVASNQSTGADV